MRKIRVYRQTAGIRWMVVHWPIRQTAIWCGPFFILIQP
jgi:hypothetical protein